MEADGEPLVGSEPTAQREDLLSKLRQFILLYHKMIIVTIFFVLALTIALATNQHTNHITLISGAFDLICGVRNHTPFLFDLTLDFCNSRHQKKQTPDAS
jgi:hypothetical protein